MIYELLNPSDEVTFEADDPRVAVAVCVVLGDGKYGLEADSGNREDGFPLLLSSTEAATDKALAAHGFSGGVVELVAFMSTEAARIADALDTLAYCSMADRKAMFAAVGSDRAALLRWNDEKRTSLNDIGAWAAAVSKGIRAKTQKSP